MKKILALSLALSAAVSVSACQTPQQNNALVGGALGAGAGAIVGSAVSGGSAGGALAGAAIGAGSGALIGAAATPHRPTLRTMGLRLQRQPRLRRVLLNATGGSERPTGRSASWLSTGLDRRIAMMGSYV